jgi:hypothetical protein
MVRECVLSLGIASSDEETDPEKVILGLLSEAGKGNAVKHLDIVEHARALKLGNEEIENALINLLSKGECYEPKAGMYKIVSE